MQKTIARVGIDCNVDVAVSQRAGGTRVAVITPEGAEMNAVAFMGLGGWLNPLEVGRFAILARAWRARIAVPEMPGCGTRHSRLSVTCAARMGTGDYRVAARDMVIQASALLGDGAAPQLLIGYSMGAAMATAALAAVDPALLPASKVVLVEPVAAKPWGAYALLSRVRQEDARALPILRQSWESLGLSRSPIPDRAPSVHLGSIAAAGLGLLAGRLTGDLVGGIQRRSVLTVAIVHGTRSLLAPTHLVAELAERASQAHAHVTCIPTPGGHALWHDLHSIAGLAERVKVAWH